MGIKFGWIAMRIYASKKFWRILIWRLLMQTTKTPNLIPHQIFRLYGRCMVGFLLHESGKKSCTSLKLNFTAPGNPGLPWSPCFPSLPGIPIGPCCPAPPASPGVPAGPASPRSPGERVSTGRIKYCHASD